MSNKKLPQYLCPRCRKQADWYDNPYRPFCSERCRILDLGAWASEEYRIAGESKEEQEEDQEKSDQKESQDDESASF